MAKWIGIIVLIIIVAVIALGLYIVAITRAPTLRLERDDSNAAQILDAWFTDLNVSEPIKFNGVALIRRGNETLLRKGYGSDALGRDLTPDSPLRLGSVSKQFTAVGILTLVQDNKIDLDAPISDYLPACVFEGSTVRNLLTHTSSIPDIYMSWSGEGYLTLEGAEAYVCDGTHSAKTNQNYAYSNTGYVLAARIIERISGQSFEDYMKEAVFEPLDMTNSRIWNHVSTRDFPERAVGFDVDAKEKVPVELTALDGVAGDGGVFSTLNDLENWDRFWSDDRLLRADLKDMAIGQGGYSFGQIRDRDIVWHNGQWLAANALFRRNLRTGDLVILIDNGTSINFKSVSQNVNKFIGD